MIQGYIIAAVIGAASAGIGAWQVQGWRYGVQIAEIEANHAKAVQDSIDAAHEKQKEITDGYIKALNDARTRETALRRDVAVASDAANSLRKQAADAARQLASQPPATVVIYATSAGDLLAECSAEYQRLAEKADGHAADVKTLIEAWPK